MTCYAVVDTNVLVSSLLTNKDDAATVQVMKKMIAGEIVLLYSNKIIDEYREVLNRKKFGFSKEIVGYLISWIEKFGIKVDPSPSGTVLLDIKDLPFYEVVLEKREDEAYLVTGNIKHFPKDPFIVTARELLDILNQKEK